MMSRFGDSQCFLRRSCTILVSAISVLVFGVVLALSWTGDSRMTLVRWLPGWLGEWADSGGKVMTIRTGVALSLAGFFFAITGRLIGWRHWRWGGFALAVFLVLLAEGGQWFLPKRTPDGGDLTWGIFGAFLGVLAASFRFRRKGSRDSSAV